jgi:tetratricopeptide (TPR) repeat protein
MAMAKTSFPGRRRGTLLLVGLLIVSAAGFSALKGMTDRIVRKKIPGSSIIYIPSGKFLKHGTFGYRALAADAIYLWAIQYYSTPAIDDRFDHIDHIFAIINELDPRYQDPYEIGAMIAVQGAFELRARQPEKSAKAMRDAFTILERGDANNPDQWTYTFNAGHIALMNLKDYALAEKYFERCMKIPGAPVFVERLRANAIFKRGDLQTSWETWLDIYNRAPDERTKKIASNHLYNVKATIDRTAIEGALAEYRKRSGRLPADLAALVKAGLLRELPKDLDGKDYVYDPANGSVRTVISPWRR